MLYVGLVLDCLGCCFVNSVGYCYAHDVCGFGMEVWCFRSCCFGGLVFIVACLFVWCGCSLHGYACLA